MIHPTAEGKSARKDKSLTATGIVIAMIVILLLSAYFKIDAVLRQRSLSRLEEGVNTAIEEITSKIERDSLVLNATADIISQADNFDIQATLAIIFPTARTISTQASQFCGIMCPSSRTERPPPCFTVLRN